MHVDDFPEQRQVVPHYSEKTTELFQTAVATHKDPETLPGRRVVGYGGSPDGQGPHIHLHLGIHERTIVDATFKTYGCPACIACSQAICMLARGRSFEEARRVTVKNIEELVGELPRAKRHCYGLALHALNDALDKGENIGG